MSKRNLFALGLLALLLLSACGSKSSWENEEVTEVSHRLMDDDVEAKWTIDGNSADGTKRIRVQIAAKDGGTIDDFDVNHEKLLHLMVVSKDLSYFRHIHPEYLGNGVFEIENRFPFGGEYRLIADFKPTDGDAMNKMAWVTVDGKTAKAVPVTPDQRLDRTVDGLRVSLNINPPASGKDVTLRYAITDAETGKSVTDLETYLGAIGHVVVLTEDGERYLHVHAEEGQGTGPDAVFETRFPAPGIYKIWAQFQRNGEVVTVPFVTRIS